MIISTVLHRGQPARFAFLLAATVVYLGGTFAVTVFGNVPLNNTLDRFELKSASVEEIALRRANFERRWNALNLVRAAASTAAVILSVLACLS